MTKVIFNEKFATLNPTKTSDYGTNYLAPEKSDYRKKRTEILYPNYGGSSISKNEVSEYKTQYITK